MVSLELPTIVNVLSTSVILLKQNIMPSHQGVYPVKMVVRGDHTCVDFYLTVLPPRTECVVFSIDGSFTASVSIWGKDPKVRAGAIDVVRSAKSQDRPSVVYLRDHAGVNISTLF